MEDHLELHDVIAFKLTQFPETESLRNCVIDTPHLTYWLWMLTDIDVHTYFVGTAGHARAWVGNQYCR